MRYVLACYKKEQKESAYRIYVTDSLQNAPQSKYLGYRYADMFVKRTNYDTRTGDEIAAEVMLSAGLKFKEYTDGIDSNDIVGDTRT